MPGFFHSSIKEERWWWQGNHHHSPNYHLTQINQPRTSLIDRLRLAASTRDRRGRLVSLSVSYPPVFGEPEGIRTLDPLIKSQVLYRLSYGLLKPDHMGL